VYSTEVAPFVVWYENECPAPIALNVVSVDTLRKPAVGAALGVGVGETPVPLPELPELGVGVGVLPTPPPEPALPEPAVGAGGAKLPTLSGPEPPQAASASSGSANTIE
jgi:hypothetical protein